MTRFLRNLLLYLVLLALVSAAVGIYYNKVVMRTSIVVRKEKQLEDCCESTEYLFVGDSHVESGINPAFFPESFNYGVGSENPIQAYYKLRHLFNDTPCGKHIKCVILSFDLHTFSERRYEEWINISYYNRYMSYLKLGFITGRVGDFTLKFFQSYLWPYANQGPAVMSAILKGTTEREELRLMDKGYVSRHGVLSDLPDSTQIAIAQRRSEFLLGSEGYAVNDRALLKYFRKTVDLCESKGIAVVFMTYPVSIYLSRTMQEDYSIKPPDERYKQLLGSYSDCPYLDYYDLFFDRTELFDDTDHLNDEGARLLTERVRDDLRVLGL